MKIIEVPDHRWKNKYVAGVRAGGNSVDGAPAAALWAVSTLLPQHAARDEAMTMEHEKQPPVKNSNFWFNWKKARVQTKGVDQAAKNNFVGGGEPAPVTFNGAMRLMLAAGQMFGLNPVQGIWEKDTSKLRFSLLSLCCGYSLLSLMGQAAVAALCIFRCFKKFDISSGTSIVFYGVNCLTTALFLQLATRWPELCRQIARTELVEPCYDQKLASKCNVTVVLILLLAAMEHVFSIIAGIGVATDCDPDQPLYESFVMRSFPWVFEMFPYNNFLGVITQFLNLQSTFNWNFTDLFIICISYYLTSCFEQVNRRIYAVRGKYMPSSFWRVTREDYCRVTRLVRRVDNAISAIVFVSFANNLYFICLQLFHTLENGIKGSPHCNNHVTSGLFGGHEHAVYFVYSFAYLMARYLAVSLLVARVHSAARAPAPALYDVPSPVYCVEVQRFLDQVTGETIALSGLQFFNVTRGLVLTVAGTIVTYELVLVQFNDTGSAGPNPTTTTTSALPYNSTTT